jgi:hypothetical protein
VGRPARGKKLAPTFGPSRAHIPSPPDKCLPRRLLGTLSSQIHARHSELRSPSPPRFRPPTHLNLRQSCTSLHRPTAPPHTQALLVTRSALTAGGGATVRRIRPAPQAPNRWPTVSPAIPKLPSSLPTPSRGDFCLQPSEVILLSILCKVLRSYLRTT